MDDPKKLLEQRDIAAATAFYWMRQAAIIALNSGSVDQWQAAMREGLHAAYKRMGAPGNSGAKGFLRYVLERDRALGLEAGGETRSSDEFIYWIKDPFLPLKDKITEKQYECLSTHGYLQAKIDYFCPGFSATLTKSPWRGDDRTEWVIKKMGRNANLRERRR